jgi:hypothetical protein
LWWHAYAEKIVRGLPDEARKAGYIGADLADWT